MNYYPMHNAPDQEIMDRALELRLGGYPLARMYLDRIDPRDFDCCEINWREKTVRRFHLHRPTTHKAKPHE